MPAVLNKKASDWRTASSSSTMCTTKLPGIAAPHFGRRLKREAEQGAPAGIRLSPQLSAMGLDDALGDGEADAHAGGLGGGERLKQTRHDLLCKSGAGGGDPDLDHALIQQDRFHHQLLFRASLHGFDGVPD